MLYRSIVLVAVTVVLSSCTHHGTFKYRNHPHNSQCKAIEYKLNQIYNGQIGSKPPVTERAKLLREYSAFGCND